MAKRAPKKKEEGSAQPSVSIGLIGHVDHGKTTLLERLSGKWTDTHSEEIKRGITIRLGYANSGIYKENGTLTTKPQGEAELLRTVSFVDAPGHESLMATMLAGATIMDGALLLIAANEQCPQPQTREHLMALEIMGIKNVVVVQNKIDLVSEAEGLKNHEQIRKFLSETPFAHAPIIPVSARHNAGINRLLEAIQEHIPTPERDPSKEPRFYVARSFDVNRPGADIAKIKGGVLGGSLQQGMLDIGMDIEIRPGYDLIEKNQRIFKPLFTKIAGLQSGGTDVEQVHPGGSSALLTTLDPAIVKSDQLLGSAVGKPGTLPPVRSALQLEVHLLNRVVGMEKAMSVEPVKKGELLMLNVNAASTVGIVDELKKDVIKCRLKLPVCADVGARITISRMLGNRFRLIGYGILQ